MCSLCPCLILLYRTSCGQSKDPEVLSCHRTLDTTQIKKTFCSYEAILPVFTTSCQRTLFFFSLSPLLSIHLIIQKHVSLLSVEFLFPCLSFQALAVIQIRKSEDGVLCTPALKSMCEEIFCWVGYFNTTELSRYIGTAFVIPCTSINPMGAMTKRWVTLSVD